MTPFRQHPLTSAGALSFAMLAGGPARAEGWAPSPAEGAFDQPGVAMFDLSLHGGYATGLVPPFRAGERQRITAGADAIALVGTLVRLSLSETWLQDDTAAAEPVSGLGDFRLGTVVKVWRSPVFSLGLGWEAKLPNAPNEFELGTDETDSAFGAWGVVGRGPWSATAAFGLAILGNPLRFANQDDVPLARLGAAYLADAYRFSLWGSADFPTSRNPARVEIGGSARYGRRWYGEVAGTAGLTAAAPDAAVTVRLGYTLPLPARAGGE